jgi:hypothetical protein
MSGSSKQFNDWGLDLVASMPYLLYSNTPRNVGPDGMR